MFTERKGGEGEPTHFLPASFSDALRRLLVHLAGRHLASC